LPERPAQNDLICTQLTVAATRRHSRQIGGYVRDAGLATITEGDLRMQSAGHLDTGLARICGLPRGQRVRVRLPCGYPQEMMHSFGTHKLPKPSVRSLSGLESYLWASGLD
jgi:hypothetical protein